MRVLNNNSCNLSSLKFELKLDLDIFNFKLKFESHLSLDPFRLKRAIWRERAAIAAPASSL